MYSVERSERDKNETTDDATTYKTNDVATDLSSYDTIILSRRGVHYRGLTEAIKSQRVFGDGNQVKAYKRLVEKDNHSSQIRIADEHARKESGVIKD